MRNALPAFVAAWRAAPGPVVCHVVTSAVSQFLPIASVWLLKVVVDALTGADRAACVPPLSGTSPRACRR